MFSSPTVSVTLRIVTILPAVAVRASGCLVMELKSFPFVGMSTGEMISLKKLKLDFRFSILGVPVVVQKYTGIRVEKREGAPSHLSDTFAY